MAWKETKTKSWQQEGKKQGQKGRRDRCREGRIMGQGGGVAGQENGEGRGGKWKAEAGMPRGRRKCYKGRREVRGRGKVNYRRPRNGDRGSNGRDNRIGPGLRW